MFNKKNIINCFLPHGNGSGLVVRKETTKGVPVGYRPTACGHLKKKKCKLNRPSVAVPTKFAQKNKSLESPHAFFVTGTETETRLSRSCICLQARVCQPARGTVEGINLWNTWGRNTYHCPQIPNTWIARLQLFSVTPWRMVWRHLRQTESYLVGLRDQKCSLDLQWTTTKHWGVELSFLDQFDVFRCTVTLSWFTKHIHTRTQIHTDTHMSDTHAANAKLIRYFTFKLKHWGWSTINSTTITLSVLIAGKAQPTLNKKKERNMKGRTKTHRQDEWK